MTPSLILELKIFLFTIVSPVVLFPFECWEKTLLFRLFVPIDDDGYLLFLPNWMFILIIVFSLLSGDFSFLCIFLLIYILYCFGSIFFLIGGLFINLMLFLSFLIWGVFFTIGLILTISSGIRYSASTFIFLKSSLFFSVMNSQLKFSE